MVADVGCGNGKYFCVRPDLTILGSDRSTGLAQQAMKLCKLPSKLGKSFIQQAPLQAIPTDSKATSRHKGSASEETDQLCRPSAELQGVPDGEANGYGGGQAGVREGYAEQGSASCMLGRAQMQACPHADVLVADAMQLPYKVWLLICLPNVS